MDDDVSHAVNQRLTRLEENAGLPPIGEEEEGDKPGQGPKDDEETEGVDE